MRVGGNLLVQNYPDWDRFEGFIDTDGLHGPSACT